MSVLFGLLALSTIAWPLPAGAQQQSGEASLHGQVVDENDEPVPRVEIEFHSANGAAGTTYSDFAGRFEISLPDASQIHLRLSKPGFFRIDDRPIDLSPGVNEISITLNHETEIQEKIEVQSSPVEIDPETTSHQESLVQHEILNIPIPSSHDLQQSIRAIPQVVPDPGGTLHVAGARPDQTEVLLDGFEINDPATGAFNSRVNVDSVRDVSIQTGGYGAEYSHASAGILALNTQSGDDRFRFGITNFIPELSFQQGTHFGNWYPRVTLSGPMKKGKIWFSDALTIEHTFTFVTGLPSGKDTDSVWSADNLFRWQANLSAKNVLQGSFLYNQASDPRSALGPLTPLSTTLNNRSTRYFVSLKDQFSAGSVVFDIGAAVDTGDNKFTPQGSNAYIVTPSSTMGNYFQSQSQQPRRLQLIGNAAPASFDWFGNHTITAGGNLDALDFSQQSARAPILFQRADGTLAEQATFSGPSAFRVANTQAGAYVQDLWRPVKPLVFSVGVRTDWDRLIHHNLVEPRVAMNWIPAGDGRMKLTIAWGEHYQPLNLSILGQGFDQQRVNVFYDATGTIPLGPPVVNSFVVPLGSLRQPRSYNTSVEWNEKISGSTFAGASFLLRETRANLAWEAQPSGSLLLENNRNDRYIAGEFWVRHAFGENAQISVDYTRSHATSNQVLDPTLAWLIASPQQSGPLPWDAPNRAVATGWTPIPIWGLLLSGFAEYRTGLPFNVLTLQQQLAAPADSMRFPNYFSLDLGLEKRFRFKGHEWAVRGSAINLTGHNNPNAVVNIVGAPNFLAFAGSPSRSFTARLRLVTQH